MGNVRAEETWVKIPTPLDMAATPTIVTTPVGYGCPCRTAPMPYVAYPNRP